MGFFPAGILVSQFGWNFGISWVACALIGLAISFVINYGGIRENTRVGVILGAFEILAFLALALTLIVVGHHNGIDNLSTKFANVSGFVGVPGVFAGAVYAILAFIGFDASAPLGEEAKNPKRAVKFAVIGSEILRGFLRDSALSRSLDDAVNHIMDGFGTLSVHPDIAEGIRGLKSMEMRLVTLSNGSAQVAEGLLAGAGLRSDFEDLLTVEDATAWKPVRAAYDYAADVCGVQPADMLLVAVHPWDIHGAAQAGLRTAWLNRTAETYPDYFAAPDYTPRTRPRTHNPRNLTIQPESTKETHSWN